MANIKLNSIFGGPLPQNVESRHFLFFLHYRYFAHILWLQICAFMGFFHVYNGVCFCICMCFLYFFLGSFAVVCFFYPVLVCLVLFHLILLYVLMLVGSLTKNRKAVAAGGKVSRENWSNWGMGTIIRVYCIKKSIFNKQKMVNNLWKPYIWRGNHNHGILYKKIYFQ